MTRAERYAQVKALRDQGLLLREISERLGLARSTVNDLLLDPTGEKARERKAKRYGICEDCGAKTYNSGSEPPKRCLECSKARQGEWGVRRNLSAKNSGQVKWTDDELIALVRRIAVDGRISVTLWDTARESDASLPSRTRLIQRFDTWGALCDKAGVKLAHGAKGHYRNRISPDECLRWLQRCADDIGRVPPCWVYEEWHRTHEGSPSQQTIRNRFGTWMAAAECIVESSDLRVAA